jgi:hypothetical protein
MTAYLAFGAWLGELDRKNSAPTNIVIVAV